MGKGSANCECGGEFVIYEANGKKVEQCTECRRVYPYRPPPASNLDVGTDIPGGGAA